MTTIAIQSLAAGEADQYAFVDEEYLSAAGKQQILADWQRFITSGFKKLFFSRDMTQQSDFFSHQQPSGPGQEPVIILNEPATRKPKKRVFVYDGQYFEDPGAEYTIEDVLSFLAQTYPELENGAWNSRLMPDDTEEITFVKVTGEKGGDVTSHLIAARLAAGTHPTRIQAIELLNQLIAAETEGALTVSYSLEAEPRIEAALHQAEQVAQASQRIVARCIALKPVPLPRVPLGF